MGYKDRTCISCGLRGEQLNYDGFCKACVIKYLKQKHDLLQKKNLNKCFNYKPVKLLVRRGKKVKEIIPWLEEPRLKELFANENSFRVWYGINKERFSGLEQLIKYRIFKRKLVSKKWVDRKKKIT